MDKLLIVIILGWMGLIFGSFAGAQVWRLRARQLIEDKQEGEVVDATEMRRLGHLVRPTSQDRSECLSCHHTLAWYDLIPLVSWISTGGRCRYCRHRIGWFEPLMEIGTATLFVVSYLAWPWSLGSNLEIARFGLWLVACVLMAILFAYDAKWSLLPYRINVALIIVSLLFLIVTYISGRHVEIPQMLSLGGALLLLAGLYFVFSVFGWVGLGDSILGVGLAFLLHDWHLAFLTVFLANLLGCLMLIPLALQKKLHHGARVPFGPFLILGAIISMLWGNELISTVLSVSMRLY